MEGEKAENVEVPGISPTKSEPEPPSSTEESTQTIPSSPPQKLSPPPRPIELIRKTAVRAGVQVWVPYSIILKLAEYSLPGDRWADTLNRVLNLTSMLYPELPEDILVQWRKEKTESAANILAALEEYSPEALVFIEHYRAKYPTRSDRKNALRAHLRAARRKFLVTKPRLEEY